VIHVKTARLTVLSESRIGSAVTRFSLIGHRLAMLKYHKKSRILDPLSNPETPCWPAYAPRWSGHSACSSASSALPRCVTEA
jgi:hypothetical protein